MPLPRWLARFNRVGTNRFFGLFAHRLPPWTVVGHRGRRSGREYSTVIVTFRTDGGLVAALTYGAAKSEWVQNVLAAGECVVRRGGKEFAVVGPRLITGVEGRVMTPLVVRPALALLRVSEYMVLPTG